MMAKRMSEKGFAELMGRRGKGGGDLFPKAKKAKYNNVICWHDGIKFQSIAEGDRYLVLRDMQKCGEIRGLDCQTEFVIVPAVKIDGKRKAARKYLADFTYYRTKDDSYVVEDVKSPVTVKLATYTMKRQLMKDVHGIEVQNIITDNRRGRKK